jgi:hypothetical protein
MILLSCRNWQKKEETGRVTFSCLADFAASRPSRYSGVEFNAHKTTDGRRDFLLKYILNDLKD